LDFHVETLIDAVDLLHAIKIAVSFYEVQYEHLKRDVVGCFFLSNFLGHVSAKNCQNWM